jgi:hypothetical protein
MRGILGVVLMAAALGVALIAGGSAAVAGTGATTCRYVSDGAGFGSGSYIRVDQPVDPPTVFIRRAGRRILLETTGVNAPTPVQCSGREPTVDNIDRIVVLGDGTRRVALDLRSGPLGPGATPEGAGPEIELFLRARPEFDRQAAKLTVVAGRAPNVVTLGRTRRSEQVNLNPRRERLDDVDVRIEDLDYDRSFFNAGLRGGDDRIDARGPGPLRPSGLNARFHVGSGDDTVFSSDAAAMTSLISGDGRDRLIGSSRHDEFRPGPGRDVVKAGGGDDFIQDYEERIESIDRFDCGPGRDDALVGAEDRLRSCERVTRVQ